MAIGEPKNTYDGEAVASIVLYDNATDRSPSLFHSNDVNCLYVRFAQLLRNVFLYVQVGSGEFSNLPSKCQLNL